MPETAAARLDMLMRVLFSLTILLYIVPAALGPSARGKVRWMGRAAIVTLAMGLVIALIMSALWFMR